MEKEFLQIIQKNQGIIYKVCSLYCDSQDDRDDLFQEIVAQLWKSYPSFRKESKVTTWMYRVALNTAITSFKKSCDISCNLRETLVKIIKTLKIYQRLFYLALIFLSAAMTVSFITGLYNGMEESAADNGVLLSDIPLPMLLLTILVGFVVLVLMVGGIFLLMRWGFRRLYGNYIHKLKNTLNELDEII